MKTFLYILQFFSAKSKKYIEKYLMINFVLEQKFILPYLTNIVDASVW